MWNEKEVHWLDTGYNIWPWPSTSIMTLTMDVWRSNFKIALSPEFMVWLMWDEKEVSWYDTGPIVWPCPLTTPTTLTLEFQVWNSFISGMGRPIDNERKGCESSLILTCVTMVRWADVPDSDQGDFRRWHAVEISSLWQFLTCLGHEKVSECLKPNPALCEILIPFVFQVAGATAFPESELTVKDVSSAYCAIAEIYLTDSW